MRSTRRHILLAAGSAALAAPALHARAATSGVALVIGNSKYRWEASLPNVRRDAPDIAKRFQAIGLKTELLQDASRPAMQQAIDKFKASARGAELAAFYFAGHGASWAKDTFLVPEDADLGNPKDVQKTLIPVSSVVEAMGDASHRLMVFDNCRNNPADGWRQLEAERAASVNPDKQREGGKLPPPNTLILYSTAPGRVALDGPAGENSPFAASLLRQLSGPSVDLQALHAKLRRDLLLATEGRQVLWSQDTYQQPFQISGGGKGGGPVPSGWSGDPSRLIELPNAYAYAQQVGLPVPQGLVVHRPAGNPRDGWKAGTFKWENKTKVGPAPFILIVLSVEEQQSAQIIIAARNENGSFWRVVNGTISGDRLDFEPNYGRPHYLLNWSDANSGGVSQLHNGVGNVPNFSARFTRLDG